MYAEIFQNRKAVIEVSAQVPVPESSEAVHDPPRIPGRDGGERVGHFGQQVMALQNELQRDIGLRQEDGAHGGREGGLGVVQFVEAARHVDALLERQDVTRPGPAVQQQARLSRAIHAGGLAKAFNREVGQGFEGAEEVGFHIG